MDFFLIMSYNVTFLWSHEHCSEKVGVTYGTLGTDKHKTCADIENHRVRKGRLKLDHDYFGNVKCSGVVVEDKQSGHGLVEARMVEDVGGKYKASI